MDTTIPMTTGALADRPVRTYIRRVNLLLFSPGRFFREEFPSFSLSDSLAFGLVSGWISSLIAFFIQTLNSLLLAALFERWMQRILATEEGLSLFSPSDTSFVWSSGFLILAPFFFLLRALLGAAVLYFFARLLVDDEGEPVTFRTMLGLRACALGGQWFSVVPIFGGFLAFLANLILLTAGVRERFRVSSRRAAAVVLAPYFLLFLFALVGTAFLLLALSQLPNLIDLGISDIHF